MKTNQLMKRDFNGSKITQRTSDKFFNATELLAVYNEKSQTKKALPEFWSNKNTQEFIKELEKDLILNVGNSLDLEMSNKDFISGNFKTEGLSTHESTRGRGGATWMHPYLFVKFAMWLSPKFELQIIKWVYDNLIDFRIDAGDYYKEMQKEVQEFYIRNKANKFSPMVYKSEADLLNTLVYGHPVKGKRNESSEKELTLMNELQLKNILLLRKNIDFQKRQRELGEHTVNFWAIESIKDKNKAKKTQVIV